MSDLRGFSLPCCRIHARPSSSGSD